MLRRMTGSDGPTLDGRRLRHLLAALGAFAAWGVVSCGGAPASPWGYEYWPEVSGTITFEPPSGAASEYPIDGDTCAGSTYQVVVGNPSEWSVDAAPFIRCTPTEVPALYLYNPSDVSTSPDWPGGSGTIDGAVWPGPQFALVDIDITMEESAGNLLNLPSEEESVPTRDDPATTANYTRRFRVQAEVVCSEVGLDCDGTWSYDATYELQPDSVKWSYPPAE